jgi:hypothetical protein
MQQSHDFELKSIAKIGASQFAAVTISGPLRL